MHSKKSIRDNGQNCVRGWIDSALLSIVCYAVIISVLWINSKIIANLNALFFVTKQACHIKQGGSTNTVLHSFSVKLHNLDYQRSVFGCSASVFCDREK